MCEDSGFMYDEEEDEICLGLPSTELLMHLLEGSTYVGHYDFPAIADKEITLPKYIVPFSERGRIKDEVKKDVALHFYISDIDFLEFLNYPEEYLDEIKKFGGIISLDLTIYTNMVLVQQLYRCFLNGVYTFFFQKHGINVVPNVSWGKPATFEFCFDGLPRGSTYAISTYESLDDEESCQAFKEALGKILETLTPKLMLVYGKMPDSIFADYAKNWKSLHFPEWESFINTEEGKALLK